MTFTSVCYIAHDVHSVYCCNQSCIKQYNTVPILIILRLTRELAQLNWLPIQVVNILPSMSIFELVPKILLLYWLSTFFFKNILVTKMSLII